MIDISLMREGKEIKTTERTWCDPACSFFPHNEKSSIACRLIESKKCLFDNEVLGFYDFYLRSISCLKSTQDYPQNELSS